MSIHNDNPYTEFIGLHNRREYELTVRQEPKQARMCGVGGKGSLFICPLPTSNLDLSRLQPTVDQLTHLQSFSYESWTPCSGLIPPVISADVRSQGQVPLMLRVLPRRWLAPPHPVCLLYPEMALLPLIVAMSTVKVIRLHPRLRQLQPRMHNRIYKIPTTSCLHALQNLTTTLNSIG